MLLAASDWTDTLSAKTRLGDAKYDEWQVYRQALRDMPEKGCTGAKSATGWIVATAVSMGAVFVEYFRHG